jgi:hypothetical protein
VVQSDNATEPYDHRGQLRLHEGPHAPEAALCVAAGAKATRSCALYISCSVILHTKQSRENGSTARGHLRGRHREREHAVHLVQAWGSATSSLQK